MIGIVAHTTRAEQAHQLMDTVGAAYLSMDAGRLGCNGNHRKTWTWLNQHTKNDFAVVLEDDAIPVEGFTTQLQQALTAAPTPIVSLYLGRKRPPHVQPTIEHATKQAEHRDAHFITATHLFHAVAVAIHKDLIGELLDHTTTTQHPWDYAIGAYAQNVGELVSYTWPSLVDHADQPTVVQHPDGQPRTPGRTAWKTGTRDAWTTTTVEMH